MCQTFSPISHIHKGSEYSKSVDLSPSCAKCTGTDEGHLDSVLHNVIGDIDNDDLHNGMSLAGDIANDDLLTMTTFTMLCPWLVTANEATVIECGSGVASSRARPHTEGVFPMLHCGRRISSYWETV